MARFTSGMLLAVVGATSLLAGCTSGDAQCAAPTVTVEPERVVAGGTVVVSGEGFLAACHDQGEGPSPVSTGLPLTLAPDTEGAETVSFGTFDAAADASVRASVTVPAETPPGPATLSLGRASVDIEVAAP